MIYQLPEDDVWFPDPMDMAPGDREDDGCFAIGGDLRPERLIEAYAQGIFPWTAFRSGYLLWYCPMERFVIFPDEVHISHSLRTLINKGRYQASIDRDFEGVINQCSQLRIDQDGAWLGPEMVEAYTRLHEIGYAHSVEVWDDERLVGGLYGVSLGRGFFGESMFSLEPSASKLALVYLCQQFGNAGGALIDCQFETPHLRSMGGRYIPYSTYMDLIWGRTLSETTNSNIQQNTIQQ